jgi:pimeloyl-ACP methyl ester carboxylesterase
MIINSPIQVPSILSLIFMSLPLPWAFAAADDPAPSGHEESIMDFNFRMPTFGGKQFWSDELVHGGWRIQRNAWSNHYRLLDPDNNRLTWGSWEHCHQRWIQLKRERGIPPLRPKVVIVLHGLGRSRASMEGLAEYLERHGAFSALNVSYASTRVPIGDDARSLGKVIEHLEGVKEIHFVAHSMGNLVIRHWMHNQLEGEEKRLDPRVGRFVMLAPPNQGASLAERFRNNPLFKLIFGAGGKQFTQDWDELQTQLATPPGDFGIIAGGGGDEDGNSPLLEGDDDMIVTVEETRLPGAADFLVVPALHTFIMDDPGVQEYTLRFLQYGHFISAQRRQPIPAEPGDRGGPR